MKRRLYSLYCATEHFKSWLSNRFTPLGRILLLCWAIALVFGLGVQRTMIFQLFTLISALLLFSYFSSIRLKSAVVVKRRVPDSCIAGRKLHYRIGVAGQESEVEKGLYFQEYPKQDLPTFDEFVYAREEGEERRNAFDKKMGYYRWLWLLTKRRLVETLAHPLPDIFPGKVDEIEVSFTPLRRGNIHLQGYVLGRVDPLGLCKSSLQKMEARNLLALPRLYQAPQLFFPGKRKYHQGGIIAVQKRGDSNEFLSLREYMHGDPIKHIDWKSTARTGSAIVKQYRDEYFSRYGLILDSFSDQQFSLLFEEAVSVAASILMAQDNVNTILDLLFVGDECVCCSSGTGLEDHKRMLEILASVSTCQDKSFAELAGLVKSHSNLLSGVVLVLIDYDEERQRLIDYLLSHNIPVKTLLLVDADKVSGQGKKKNSRDFSVQTLEMGKVEAQLAQL